MNKTAAYIGVVIIVILGLGGVLLLSALNLDAGPFTNLFMTTLPIAITAAVTFHGLEKVKEQTDKISRNVNGNTSKLIEIAQRNVMTRDEALEIDRIAAENDDLLDRR